ncbi:hypothetical protein [Variovorax saccharolyticus]|uniref:hypothetical protein n=1 Tax=Variovorax saccharolyticus TaxID=3053516 RepID=UPI0025787249|nr:hypothetical protein [Variovorax sp. J31P216]MDM0024109.1 hypothetical protein [Variovorax sp. J31P216]
MERSELLAHKRAAKHLSKMPEFKAAKKGRLPAPYDRFKSKRLSITDITPVGEDYSVVFMWRNGDLLTDTVFYAHLLQRLPGGRFYPLFEFHWHPSHKGFHCVTPCRTSLDYTGRMLSGGAPELAMETDPSADPRTERGREKLVTVFCSACNIKLGFLPTAAQVDIWS